MENVCENITLDLLDIHSMAAITVNQGDTARILKIYFEEQGVPYRLGDGCYAVLVGRKPDGTFLYNPCAIEKNHVIYQFTPQTASAQGEVNCEIRLYDSDDQMITSGKFQIFVMEPICIDDLVESKEEVTVLTHLVSEAATVIRDGNNLLLQGKNVLDTAEDVLEESQRAKAESSKAAEVAAKEADNAMRIVGDANKVILQANQSAANADSAAARANASSELAEDAYALARFADTKVDALREVVGKFHNNIVCEEMGEVIILSDSAEVPLQSLKLYGKTAQNGMPTPKVPVPLESVGDSGTVSVTACGKNLLKNTATTQNIQGVIFTVNNDGSITATNKAGSRATMLVGEVVLPAGSYVLSQGNITNADVCLYAKYTQDGENKYADCYGASVSGTAGFTLNQETSVAVYIDVRDVDVAVNKTLYPMIRITSVTDNTYEPYKGTTATISTPNGLPGIPVTSGGNYTDPVTKQQWLCDEVDFEKGVYVQRVGKILNKGTNARTVTVMGNYVRTYFAGVANTGGTFPKALSDCLPYLVDYLQESEHFYVASNGDLFCFLKSERLSSADAAGVQAYFADNPLTVLYVLGTPIPHDLTAEELAQYAAMHTNYPNTTVLNDAGAHMDLKYVVDTKKYVDKKFAELAAALVSST